MTSRSPVNQDIAMRRTTLTFICATIALDILAMGIVIPVLPKLLEGFLDGDSIRAAAVFGWFGMACGLMQFLCSPLLGALSDRFGRRPVILLACLGMGLDYVVMALAPGLAWLFIARIISGITGSTIGTALAYVADVTPPEQRAGSYGMATAALTFGIILGPALGGVLGGIGSHLPFWAAAGLCLLNALYGFFVLPESLPHDRRFAFSWKRANPVGALALLRSHPELAGLAGVAFLSVLAEQVFPSTAVLYSGYRYGASAMEIGLTLTGLGLCAALVQGKLVRPMMARFGERRTLIIGLLFSVAGLIIYGLAPLLTWFWLGVPAMALGSLAQPALQSLMTQCVAPCEQGQLQGAGVSAQGIAAMLGPGLFAQTYACFIEPRADWQVPGAAFFLAASIVFAAAVLAWRVTRHALPVNREREAPA
jgi:DHA1 family tetracycline resistance protein-like MFS transporter